MVASLGTLGQLGLDSANPVTKRFDYMDENLVMAEEIVDGNGVRGTRSRNVDRVRMGLQRIHGPIRFQPNAVEMSLLLEWIMGGTPTGTGTVTYPLADTLPSRYVTIDRIAKVFTYATAKVDQATFRCSQGHPLELDLQVVAITETVANSGTFPSLSIDTANGPWIFSDCVLSVGGTTVSAKEATITVNNHVDKDRFFNSLTMATVETLDREITFSTLVPYGDFAALYGASSSSGLQVVATFTNGGAILTMTMVKVVLPRKSPNVPGRREVMLRLEGHAFRSGSTLELVTTLNNGP